MGNTESVPADLDDEQRPTDLQQQQRNNNNLRSLSVDIDNDADPWWWEVENANLILDHMPNVTSVYNDHSNTSENNDDAVLDSTMAIEHLNPPLTLAESVEETRNSEQVVESNTPNCEIAKENKQESTSAMTHLRSDAGMAREQTLDEFKEELRVKRLARKTAVQDLRDEIASLRKQLVSEQALTCHLRKNIDGSVPSVPCSNNDDEDESTKDNDVVDFHHQSSQDTKLEEEEYDDAKNRSRHANIELANMQLQLQMTNSENLSLRSELNAVRKQVGTLKEVISCCKQMLAIKEDQCTQLKNKLTEIETSFAEREMDMMSDNLRIEYERQLENIRQLRQLYEERQRVGAAEHENLQRLLSIKKDELTAEKEKTKALTDNNLTLAKEIKDIKEESSSLRDDCKEVKLENDTLKEQMNTINTLFTQMIIGFNGKNNINIDRLAVMLEENRDLLNEMTMKEVYCGDGATLPKLLFELFEQASVFAETAEPSTTTDKLNQPSSPATTMEASLKTTNSENISNEKTDVEDEEDGVQEKIDADSKVETGKIVETNATGEEMPFVTSAKMIGKVVTAEEITNNLPKVWKVLMELLSHHSNTTQVQLSCDVNGSSDNDDCYKSIQTSNGPKNEISVSKTYIKLKDLILEKKSLVKETNRLKTLNTHLDYRLNEQEKRLSVVSLELSKTWHLVGKMQRQHRQLHTQEQILRYQLQQKRRLLSELKDELQHCRRKWTAARAKNDESQMQCNDLRQEFAKRKLEDANHHSAESGYSDGASASEDDALMADGEKDKIGATGGCSRRRQRFRELFEHTRQIKRMKSTSPGRAAMAAASVSSNATMIRCNSAPSICSWWPTMTFAAGATAVPDGTSQEPNSHENAVDDVLRINGNEMRDDSEDNENESTGEATASSSRATRIQRLEEQCKSLIQQVLETSDNRERLEMQLCRFQHEIVPAPLGDLSDDRMARASSAPATAGVLTAREEEYTRKRSERLERLEEESRQLMSRIKRTTDRGHYLGCSLDRIRRAPSREGSFDSTEPRETKEIASAEAEPTPSPSSSSALPTESTLGTRSTDVEEQQVKISKESNTSDDNTPTTSSPTNSSNESHLTIEQRIDCMKSISDNRDERLQLLKEEGDQLLARLSNTLERGTQMVNRIDQRKLNKNSQQNADKGHLPIATASESEQRIASEMLPTPQSIVCTSIVEEELKSHATVSTTASHIGRNHQGAIPKVQTQRPQQPSKELSSAKSSTNRPAVELSAAARTKSNAHTSTRHGTSTNRETLEDMVKRLQTLPFPEEDSGHDQTSDANDNPHEN